MFPIPFDIYTIVNVEKHIQLQGIHSCTLKMEQLLFSRIEVAYGFFFNQNNITGDKFRRIRHRLVHFSCNLIVTSNEKFNSLSQNNNLSLSVVKRSSIL